MPCNDTTPPPGGSGEAGSRGQGQVYPLAMTAVLRFRDGSLNVCRQVTVRHLIGPESSSPWCRAGAAGGCTRLHLTCGSVCTKQMTSRPSRRGHHRVADSSKERNVFRLRKVPLRALLAGSAALSLVVVVAAWYPASMVSAPASGATTARLSVTWMPSYAAPGTPAQYNKVGVLKIGPSSAKNVLVLEPGTSAGSAYFAPLAEWIVARTPGWQVSSVERRRICSRTNRS